jgi:hypothetical protein
MKYYAKVIEVNDDIEEEILLDFGEVSLYCFISSCPYEVVVGKIYPVDISLSFLDSEVIEPQLGTDLSATRQGDGFLYEIRGLKVDDKIFINGLTFCDEIYMREYSYINHEYVEMKPDRISVSFL